MVRSAGPKRAKSEAISLRRPAPARGDGEAVARFRAAAAALPLKPLEPLDRQRRPAPERFKNAVEKNFYGDWELEGCSLPSINPPIAWATGSAENRARLQGLAPIATLIAAHELTGRADYRDMALSIAEDWIERFLFPGAKTRAAPGADWSPGAVAARSHRLAYLLDGLCHDSAAPVERISLFFDAFDHHLGRLAAPGATEAGLDAAVARLAALERFSWHEPWAGQIDSARAGVAQAIGAAFSAEGVHSSLSAAEQLGAVVLLTGARSAGLLRMIPGADDAIALAEAAAGALILPDGRLAPFRSSAPERPASFGTGDRFQNKELIYGLSHGASGRAPGQGVFAAPEAGLAVARCHSGDASRASYLALLAGPAPDCGGFIWSEGAVTILADPARPAQGTPAKLSYFTSAASHNVVDIEGESGAERSGRLTQAEIQDGLVVVDLEIRHGSAALQQRSLILGPNQFLMVIDWVRMSDGRPRDVRQCFKLSPEWTASVVGDEAVAASRDNRSAWVSDLLGAPVAGIWRGASVPMRGWAAPGGEGPVPACDFAFERRQVSEAAFASLFLLDGWSEMDEMTGITAFGRDARFAFRVGEETVEIGYRRDDRVRITRTLR